MGPVTYEHVEGMAKKLTPGEQLRLVAAISDRLSKQSTYQAQVDEEGQGSDYAIRVQAFIEMIEANAAETIEQTDSAADIRQIREERVSQL